MQKNRINETERVSLFFQGNRTDVNQDSKGKWYSEIHSINNTQKIDLKILILKTK